VRLSSSHEHVTLKRELNFWDLVMVSLGGVIGSGWLYGAWRGAQLAGPASILSWIIGGVLAILLGLTFAELAGMFPEAGALARYPQFSHGTFVSFVMSWAMILAFGTVPPIEAEAAVQFANYYVPGLYVGSTLTSEGLLLCVALMIVFFVLNFFGVLIFAKTNTVWTIIKIVVPAGTIVGLLIAAVHFQNLDAARLGGFTPYGTAGIFAAVPLGGIIYAYEGFEQCMDMAGEAKNPQRDVPRAVILSIVAAIVLYVLLQVVWLVAMPARELHHGWLGITWSSPFVNLAGALGMGWLTVVLYADAIWSPAGSGNVFLASTARVIYAMSRNRYFPQAFAWISKKSHVPYIAVIVSFLVGLIFLAPFPSWAALVGVDSSATVLIYMIGPISSASLRKTAPDLKRPYRLGGMSVIGPLAFIVCSLVIYWSGWATDSVIMMSVLAGVLLYAYGVSSFAVGDERYGWKSIKAGLWLVVYLVVMLVLSFFGSKQFGAAHPFIAYPWDMLVVAAISVVFYYWGANSGIETEEIQHYKKEGAFYLEEEELSLPS